MFNYVAAEFAFVFLAKQISGRIYLNTQSDSHSFSLSDYAKKRCKMTEIVEDFIDISYEIRSSITNVNFTNVTSNWELIRHVLSNDNLLAELANRTALSAKYINETILSIYLSVSHIENAYNLLNNLDQNEGTLASSQTYVSHIKVLIFVLPRSP